jgi:NADH:ubiquinone oxidoreductase subunit K
MYIFRRIAVLLVFFNIPLGFILYGACYNQYLTRRFWLAYLIRPFYDNEFGEGFLLLTIFVILLSMLLCIIAYAVKSEKKAKVFIIIALILTLTESAILVNEYYFAYKAKTYFNPEIVAIRKGEFHNADI